MGLSKFQSEFRLCSHLSFYLNIFNLPLPLGAILPLLLSEP